MKDKKILVIYKHDASFVHKDIELLSERYDVDSFYFKSMKDIWKLRKAIKKADIIYIWFASYHAFITTLLTRKPKVVVTGGYDVAGEREIGYGLMLNPITKWMVKFVLKRATILAVSQKTHMEIINHLSMHSYTVDNCTDTDKFKPSGEKDNNLIITVGNVNKETWIRKGISKFVELAELSHKLGLPYKFVVVGKIDPNLYNEKKRYIESKGSNIGFTGYVFDNELIEWYQRAKVYCQLSYYESFGLAPAEAMLCECVPVVTDRIGLQIGDTGIIVPYGNKIEILNAIKRATTMDGKPAKQLILKKYNPEIRKKKLFEIVEGIK